MKINSGAQNVIKLILFISFFLSAATGNAQTNTFQTAGTWEKTSNWSLGTIPTAGETVVIAANCTINSATIPATGAITSLTVNSGKTLTLQYSGTTLNTTTLTVTGTLYMEEDGNPTTDVINITTLNVSGILENDDNDITATINTKNVNLSGSGYIDLADGNTNNSSSTTLNVTGNFSATGTSVIHHSNGNGAACNVNFNGSNVIQTWSTVATFPDYLPIFVDGTNNSLQLLSAATLSGKTTVSVSSGDTLDCQTYQLSGMSSTGGGVTISSGAVIKIGSTTGLNGNVSSSNTANSFSAGATYIYTGTANQTATGSLLPTTISGALIVRNTGSSTTANNQVTLSGATTVSGTLTLQDGLLTTTKTDVLIYTGTATSSGGDSISFVNGPMEQIGAIAYEFPVGGLNGTKERFMPFGISTSTALTTITVQYFFGSPGNLTNLGSGLSNVSSIEYWKVSQSNTTTTPIYFTLYWADGKNAGDNSVIYAYSTDLRVAQYTGGKWNDLGSNGTTGGPFPLPGSVTATTSESTFAGIEVTFGSKSGINPLPITLTSFTAVYEAENKSVYVDWTAATQINNKEFVIQKTLDGINYRDIAEIPGAGTTPFPQSYSAVDSNPSSEVSYYRLEQIDIDGNPSYFPPVSVFIGNIIQSDSFTIYPNPVISLATLYYVSGNNHPVTLSIIDISGKTVSSSTYNRVQAGENNFMLNTACLEHGIYILRLDNGQETYCRKFIKQ